MAHIRKISLDDARALMQAAAEEANGPVSEFQAAASFNAVECGRSDTHLYYLVNRNFGVTLPGDNLCAGYGDLPEEDAQHILECTYEGEEDFEGESVTVIKRVKLRDLPEGVEAVDTGLIPVRFA